MREAREADLPRLLVLLEQLASGGQQPADAAREVTEQHRSVIGELIADQRYRLLVLEHNGVVQGSCVLYSLPNLSHGAQRWGVVENVIVEATARGRRYGELLMAEAVRLAEASGCYKVSLMSNVRRPDAHRFYERIGFTPTHKGFTNYLNER